MRNISVQAVRKVLRDIGQAPGAEYEDSSDLVTAMIEEDRKIKRLRTAHKIPHGRTARPANKKSGAVKVKLKKKSTGTETKSGIWVGPGK